MIVDEYPKAASTIVNMKAENIKIRSLDLLSSLFRKSIDQGQTFILWVQFHPQPSH